MIPGLQLPTRRPASAEEAVLFANQTLESVGLLSSKVTLVQPPSGTDPFQGAIVEIILPESELVVLVTKIIQTKAAEQGGKASDIRFRLEQTGPQLIKVACSVVAKMMMASLPIQLEGEIYSPTPAQIGLRKLSLDAGSGMFANMASAMIRPRLAQVEGRAITLEQIAGMPLVLESLELENGALKLRVSASAT